MSEKQEPSHPSPPKDVDILKLPKDNYAEVRDDFQRQFDQFKRNCTNEVSQIDQSKLKKIDEVEREFKAKLNKKDQDYLTLSEEKNKLDQEKQFISSYLEKEKERSAEIEDFKKSSEINVEKLREEIKVIQRDANNKRDALHKRLLAELADARQMNGSTITLMKQRDTEIARLNKELKTARTEITYYEGKLVEAENRVQTKRRQKKAKLEDLKREMKGEKDDVLKLLADRHEQVVIDLNLEIDKLNTSHAAEILKLKGELADVQQVLQTERAAHQANLETEKQRLKGEYENFKLDYKESLQGRQDDTLKQKDEEIGKLKEEIRGMGQRHQQELSDEEAKLEGLRLSDGEKIEELEESKGKLQQKLDDKIQDNTKNINDLLQKQVKSENKLREEKRELGYKIDELERQLDKMRRLHGYSEIDD